VSEHDDNTTDEPAGEHVLVVDDDPFIARLLEIELRAAGYDVRVAGDGVQALEAAQERSPDLVLADVMMPNMDGFELTRRLRQDPRTASVSVIMLTARGLSADKLVGFSVGADDYIVKPFAADELLARVRSLLRRSAPTEATAPALTTNELEVVRLLKDGLSPADIARKLEVSPSTAQHQIEQIFEKLGV
jgi:DNA-binding response OmpR family regulator